MAMNHRLLRPRASGGGFDPRRISDIFYWLDATNIGSLRANADGTGSVSANGDLVGNWQNIAGTAGVETSQTTAANRPQYQSAGINGRPALLFNAASAPTQFNQTFPGIVETTICFAIKAELTAGVHGLIGGTSVSRPSSLQIRSGLWCGVSGSTVQNFGITATTSPLVGIFTQTSSLTKLQINAETATLSYGTSLAYQTQIIGQSAFNEFYNGYIGEIIRYSRALTNPEQGAILQYLRRKWGVA